MAAGILALLGRIRLLVAPRPTLAGCCGMKSRPPFTPVSEDDVEDEENEENEEQAILNILKRREKAIRFHRMKREMEPPGAPERRLTWNAMEQIRYLKQEFPEEWTIPRLANGFNVSTDVIRRVLKSKFVPSEARKMKQDNAVSRNLGHVSPKAGKEQLHLVPPSKPPTQPLLPHGDSNRKLLVSQSPTLLPSPKTSDMSHVAASPKTSDMSHVAAMTERHKAIIRIPQNTLQRVQEAQPPPAVSRANLDTQEEPVPSDPEEDDWEMPDEMWDGEVLSDQEMEELAEAGLENKMKVVQKGREFFDGDGNFLYSI